MTFKPNVVTITQAAVEKDCTRQSLYNAIERGQLRTARLGSVQVIVRDKRYREYVVAETGGRTHRRKRNAKI